MLRLIARHKLAVGNILVFLLIVCLFAAGALDSVDMKTQDLLYQRPGLIDPRLLVVGIDEKTLDTLGPIANWPRSLMADAISALNQHPGQKPSVIGIDILYTGTTLPEADDALVRAVREGGNVVLASKAVIGDVVIDDENGVRLSRGVIVDYEKPFDALLEQAASCGLVNGLLDKDGVVRNALIKADYEGEAIYSFPVEIFRRYTGALPNVDASQFFISYAGVPGDYYGARGTGLSFCDLLDDNFDPALFADTIVLIGPYASGMMDSYATPASRDERMYGIEIHANTIQAMLDDNYKSRAPKIAELLILLAILGLSLALGKLDIRIALGAVAALSVGYGFLAVALFSLGIIVTPLYPLFSMIVLYLYRLGFGYVLEMMEKRRIKSIFQKYTDPQLVDSLVKNGIGDSDEVGVKRHIAVLFVDIRGFTPMSERLREEPETIIGILNEYLELTSSAVFNNGGSVDKFVGDATMALFNGFIPLDDYVFRAVKTAWDIVSGAENVNRSIREKYGVDVGFGVGIQCGEAIVGNIGPSFRKDYTAIGDTVNTAARLESNAKASQVLIAREVYEAVEDRIEAVSIGLVPLKGKSVGVEVFSVTGIKRAEKQSRKCSPAKKAETH